jgi:hypothetical protein
MIADISVYNVANYTTMIMHDATSLTSISLTDDPSEPG